MQSSLKSSLKYLPPKPNYGITAKEIYTTGKQINVSLVKQKLYEGQLIEPKELISIIKDFHHIIKNQPNVISLNDPVIIVGDIHGQFYDLVKILALFSQQKISSEKYLQDPTQSTPNKRKTTFVFLGDYVDRGDMAIQVMSVLMLMKIASPQNVIMLRGNHESRNMAEIYSFKIECNQKYNQSMFDMFMDAFDSLPLACVVNKKYFCVHGGITEKLKTVQEMQKMDRKIEVPLTGPICDFIWSDPTPSPTGKMKGKTSHNDSRECSIYYGAELTDEFLQANKLQTIIRGHEVFQQGYKSCNWLNREVPQVITIFSAPNYCGSYGNKGTVMRIDSDKVKIRQYNQEVPENYRLADRLEVFRWSLQYILKTVNSFSECMMDRICEVYIEDLVDEPIDKKLAAFLYYYQKNSSRINEKYGGNDLKKKFSIKDIQEQERKKPMTEEEEKEFLFRRSQEYYKDSHKIPPANRFKSTNTANKMGTTI